MWRVVGMGVGGGLSLGGWRKWRWVGGMGWVNVDGSGGRCE